MPFGGEIQQLIELVASKRVTFGGALHFDEAAAVVHDDVHVGLGVGIFGVVEIQHRHARPDADRHRSDLAVNRAFAQHAFANQRVDRVDQRDVAAGDRRRARAAVGLQHVAIERDGAFAERLQIDDGAQRATDEPLNFQRAAALLAGRCLARLRVCVARGSMPYSAVTQPRPVLRRKDGTVSSTLAVHSTRVSPNSTSTEPSA